MNLKSAGIIAAGDGTRFKKAGFLTPKPLIPVRGFPLIGHVLKNMEESGFQRVVILFNESESECVEWVRQNFRRFQLEFIVKSTRSSYESFCLVGKKLGDGRHLISTADTLCSQEEFRKVHSFKTDPKSNSIYLGVTETILDEKPLWASLDPLNNRILQLGTPAGPPYATCGFYNVPSEIFKNLPIEPVRSLRTYLGWLQEKGVPMFGVILQDVFDVDDIQDIEFAERRWKR